MTGRFSRCFGEIFAHCSLDNGFNSATLQDCQGGLSGVLWIIVLLHNSSVLELQSMN